MLGLKVVLNQHLTEKVLHAKSPSRARRRAKLGYRQCYRTRPKMEAILTHDSIIMHPALYAELKDKL